MKPMRLGVHISGFKDFPESLEKARGLKTNTMQIFTHSPRVWQGKSPSEESANAFREARKNTGISPVFIHASYLINPASPDKKLYAASISACIREVRDAGRLGADYYVTHMGSHKQTSEAEGIERLVAALNKVAEATSDSGVVILLENTAGGGSSLGYSFAHHKEILRGLGNKDRFGLCFDTCHAYAAGYNIGDNNGLQACVEEVRECAGLERLKLIHLNDCSGKLGSHLDRHEHLGKGALGNKGITRIINHAELRDKPFILETPKDTPRSDIINLNKVRKMREG